MRRRCLAIPCVGVWSDNLPPEGEAPGLVFDNEGAADRPSESEAPVVVPSVGRKEDNGYPAATFMAPSRFGGAIVIDVQGLTKVYTRARGNGAKALDGATFTVPDRSIFGFLGPNGAGKTTTIRILATILEPTEGTAIVEGHDIRTDPLAVKAAIGYMPEYPGYYPTMTAEEHLDYWGRFYHMPKAERAKRGKELLDLVGLGQERTKKVKAYSHGMLKRLGLAQALLHDPRVLILDEPAGGLDPYGIIFFRKLMKDLNREGKTILLASHILSEVARDLHPRRRDRQGEDRRGRHDRGAPVGPHRRRGGALPDRGAERPGRGPARPPRHQPREGCGPHGLGPHRHDGQGRPGRGQRVPRRPRRARGGREARGGHARGRLPLAHGRRAGVSFDPRDVFRGSLIVAGRDLRSNARGLKVWMISGLTLLAILGAAFGIGGLTSGGPSVTSQYVLWASAYWPANNSTGGVVVWVSDYLGAPRAGQVVLLGEPYSPAAQNTSFVERARLTTNATGWGTFANLTAGTWPLRITVGVLNIPGAVGIPPQRPAENLTVTVQQFDLIGDGAGRGW